MQQGEELRQSSHALWLQGEELRASVEQQRELVNVTREQLSFESEVLQQQREEIERNTKPRLSIVPGYSVGAANGRRLYNFNMLNHGKACTGLKIYFDDILGTTADALASGGRLEFRKELPPNAAPFIVKVTYLDERLLPGSKSFQVSQAGRSFEIAEL